MAGQVAGGPTELPLWAIDVMDKQHDMKVQDLFGFHRPNDMSKTMILVLPDGTELKIYKRHAWSGHE